jgi:hypothetical protein
MKKPSHISERNFVKFLRSVEDAIFFIVSFFVLIDLRSKLIWSLLIVGRSEVAGFPGLK